MAGVRFARLRLRTFVIILTALVQLTFGQFSVPDVTFNILKPKGFEASIPDVSGITFFTFNGHINRKISSNDVGSLKGEILQATNGRWVYRNTDATLKNGDVINYYVFVTYKSTGYLRDQQKYTVAENQQDPVTPTPACQVSLTKVRGGKACSGQVIFQDDFDELRSDMWNVEQYIPVYHPENPFVSYQRLLNEVVSVSGGYLHITPKLQQSMSGYNSELINVGTLDLYSGCTASADECYRQATGPDILPPVASGRLTSSSFSFTYGTVYIRAKLPQGDWIYPEILLEPFLKKYGRSNFASGVIKIASARGNKVLRAGADEYGNKVLYGGPVMDFQCRHELLSTKVMSGGKLWGDDFHVYSIKWAPEKITLYVDDEEWASIDTTTPLHRRFPDRCSHVPRMLLSMGSNLAPFDDYFYLTLGVAVGGISEFRDHTYTTDGSEKPWLDTSRKAMLNFWRDQSNWQSTWNQPELLIDYVKVVAL